MKKMLLALTLLLLYTLPSYARIDSLYYFQGTGPYQNKHVILIGDTHAPDLIATNKARSKDVLKIEHRDVRLLRDFIQKIHTLNKSMVILSEHRRSYDDETLLIYSGDTQSEKLLFPGARFVSVDQLPYAVPFWIAMEPFQQLNIETLYSDERYEKGTTKEFPTVINSISPFWDGKISQIPRLDPMGNINTQAVYHLLSRLSLILGDIPQLTHYATPIAKFLIDYDSFLNLKSPSDLIPNSFIDQIIALKKNESKDIENAHKNLESFQEASHIKSFLTDYYFLNLFLGDVGFLIDLNDQLNKKNIIIISAGSFHLGNIVNYLLGKDFINIVSIPYNENISSFDAAEKNLPFPKERELKVILGTITKEIEESFPQSHWYKPKKATTPPLVTTTTTMATEQPQ